MKKSSITDIPRNVSLGEKDNFGIEPFEKGLTTFIDNTNTPITISLQGEWGSGKTSLMNSLKKNLSDREKSKYYSVWLNTWEYALMKDASTTLIDIITKLIEEVSKTANIDKEKVIKLLKNVKKFGLSVLKVASSFNSFTSTGYDEVVKSINQDEEVTISKIRDELEEIITNCLTKDSHKQGFIFFIDDLDRIDPPVAVQLLELIKNIFTLKNCVFILAIDYDVVIKGLEPKFGKISEQNEREFRSFFDKIIQVPFSMPVTSYKIDTFLKDSLISIDYISDKNANDVKLISQFSEISNLSVGSNPRALKRLMNSLSLIKCINSAKNDSTENDQLNDELELLVNFALVSIQIAYPPVYRLLSLYSSFDKWDEKVALQMNLKQLDAQSVEKLNNSEEFDEEWEKVLFRLCENDHYLKKRALSISRLLNTLKNSITAKGEDIEDTINSIISLSSVTNLEAFDKPIIDYHRGNFLKNLRNLLIPQLKKELPDIAKYINDNGRKVIANAFIKFTERNDISLIKLFSQPYEGAIRLIISSERWMTPTKGNTSMQSIIIEAGFEAELNAIEKEYGYYIIKYPNFNHSTFYKHVDIRHNEYVLSIYSYLTLPNIDEFYKDENIKNLSLVISDMYRFIVRLDILKNKVSDYYKVH
ncbi:MAG TPA: P-loop NTPase fold protein [Chitinophagales bacterium]|nr:P-loop NTPase fold protein [Chitinophagales bacterium]